MEESVTASPAPPARVRNAATTRAAILAAARARFAQGGYECASLREIAADAGVDAALISRYFGSKEELFGAVLACGHGAGGIFEGDRSKFGERAARMLVLETPDAAKLDHLLVILHSVSSPKAADVLRSHGRDCFYGPMEEWLGGGDCQVRARLIGGVIMGFAIARAVDGTYALDEAGRQALAGKLAKLLQAAVD